MSALMNDQTMEFIVSAHNHSISRFQCVFVLEIGSDPRRGIEEWFVFLPENFSQNAVAQLRLKRHQS